MRSERAQRQIDRLLDEAEAAVDRSDWATVRDRTERILVMDPDNTDALAYHGFAERGLQTTDPSTAPGTSERLSQPAVPATFVNGRYAVNRFLGEGGKKKVYLAHDSRLDRDVAFALIKTEGLDDEGRQRIEREAQSMGRLGAHPHIVSVFDLGDEAGQPFIVTELMGGGDVEGLIEEAEDHRLPLERVLQIAQEVCRGLEFAHEKGIIHRDLKPGNVWLTSDGTAKIGDFGLAVATDRSRLTQAGMMVGTVSYMPPEQALGGEVSPRCDLYSLGAMLYEMVCGRPPFVGDQSVVIITQHLETPPIAPSWHRADCPPRLETLLLRLLEKDPGKRPASASEVSQLLREIALIPTPSLGVTGPESLPLGEGGAEGRPLGGGEAATASPIYSRVFVGREMELRQLQAAFDAAFSGQESLHMVVGEPGIGKTALCEQLATHVAVRGGRALFGHCYDQGSLPLPYLPFIEALRTYVATKAPEGLKLELGSDAGHVARIVSEIRERLQVHPPADGDPEDDRWQLFQAITSFLRRAAAVQPLLLVLEDLHWADQGTLDLLLHVARNLQGARVLVVGTYRDVEVDRAHPLAATLAALWHTSSADRILLRGLASDVVQRMLSGLATQEVSQSLTEAVHRQTDGNPLFIQEVVRYLVGEGLIQREGERWRATGSTPLAMTVPEGLRDVIGRRLSALSPVSNRLLSTGSVIGREFQLGIVQQVTGIPDEESFAALDEAKKAAVVEEQASAGGVVTYRFAHAFFRQTLYEEMIAPRRIQVHQQVALALEKQFSGRLDEHAGELAEHFSHSSDAPGLAKAVEYGTLAARRAMGVYAYGDAIRHLERCLEVLEISHPGDGSQRCDLLPDLGRALLAAGEPLRAAAQVSEEALALADSLPDSKRAFQACRLALEALFRYGERPACASNERDRVRRWLELAHRYSASGTAERAWVDSWVALYQRTDAEPVEAAAFRRRARDLAQQAGDLDILFCGAAGEISGSKSPSQKAEQLRLAETVVAQPAVGISTINRLETLWHTGQIFLEWGRREEAEALWREAEGILVRTQDAYLLVHGIEFEVLLATLDGRLEDAVAAAERMVARGEALGSAAFARPVAAALVCYPLLHLGRAEEALTAAGRRPGAVGDRLQMRALAHLGRRAAAQEALERMNVAQLEDETAINQLTALLETAVLVDDRAATAILAPRLAAAPTLVNAAVGSSMVACIPRQLGAASALLGSFEEARAYDLKALEVCSSIGFRPEGALTHLQLAELLLQHYPEDRTEALTHLDFAIDEFRAMKMQPALERALRHKGLLKA